MKKLPKADTFGREGEWQVDPQFLVKLRKKLDVDDLYEELLDEVLEALVENGYLEWED